MFTMQEKRMCCQDAKKRGSILSKQCQNYLLGSCIAKHAGSMSYKLTVIKLLDINLQALEDEDKMTREQLAIKNVGKQVEEYSLESTSPS